MSVERVPRCGGGACGACLCHLAFILIRVYACTEYTVICRSCAVCYEQPYIQNMGHGIGHRAFFLRVHV